MTATINKFTLYKVRKSDTLVLGSHFYDMMHVLNKFSERGVFTTLDVIDCFGIERKAYVNLQIRQLVACKILTDLGVIRGNLKSYEVNEDALANNFINKWLMFENMFDSHLGRPCAAAILDQLAGYGPEMKYQELSDKLELKAPGVYISMRKDSIPKINLEMANDGKLPYLLTLNSDGQDTATLMHDVSNDLKNLNKHSEAARHLFI